LGVGAGPACTQGSRVLHCTGPGRAGRAIERASEALTDRGFGSIGVEEEEERRSFWTELGLDRHEESKAESGGGGDTRQEGTDYERWEGGTQWRAGGRARWDGRSLDS
jgi:hypothetical protein